MADDGLVLVRRVAVAAGVVTLLGQAFLSEGRLSDQLALAALALFGIATLSGWLQLILSGRPSEPFIDHFKSRNSRAWRIVTISIPLLAAIAVQTWLRPGTTVAGGDLVVPDGTAWIGRLFDPWTWGGSNLGEPSQLPLALPWALILGTVHGLGGEAGLAQGIWYTMLFAGAGTAFLGLAAALRVGPWAALVGACVYLLNPYVVTWVNTNDVYLAALFLLAAIPAALVAAGTGRLPIRWSVALVAGTAPLLGYAFLNPPLVGMIIAAALAAPFLVAWVDGREAGLRSLGALLLASALLVAASAYWIVPVALHLSGSIPVEFTKLSGWLWEEQRASIRNAIWLNTHWGWQYPEYFPYAGPYDQPPLSVARFILPAIAFGALAVGLSTRDQVQRFWRDRDLRLTVATATVALIVILFSTGTNPPGNTIFLPLYNLPLGWLLREPARFLMLAALAYAILVTATVAAMTNQVHRASLQSGRWRLVATRIRTGTIVPIALGLSFLLGFPIYTGTFVPDTGPTLASWAISARPTHVKMPAYWTEMARFTDSVPTQGAVLVMPPDDWYEMPYTWYYGTDAFAVELFKRRVLLPTAQTYSPASSKLISAINLTSQSILHRDWHQAESLVRVLNAPLILVRGDIIAPYPNHSIVPSGDLASGLEAAPNFYLLRQIGPLKLFVFKDNLIETATGSRYMTIDTQSPDLNLLPLLPPNTELVSSQARAGVPSVTQAPPIELWQTQGSSLVWRPTTDPFGHVYRVAELGSDSVIPLNNAGTFVTPRSKARVVYRRDAAGNAIVVLLTPRTAISNGDFVKGQWGPVGDCNAIDPLYAKPYLGATVLVNAGPSGLPALQLSASFDSACENKSIDWHGGPLLVNVMVHHLQGNAPRICLWESGVNHCASLPPIPDGSEWTAYRKSITPDAGTTALNLYLYADAFQLGSIPKDGALKARHTINEYANVQVVEVPALSNLVLLDDPGPLASAPMRLVVVHSSFSNDWQGPANSQHVLVDGMLNGWLMPAGPEGFSALYKPADAFRAAEGTSIATLLVLVCVLPFWDGIARLARRLRLSRWAKRP